MLWHSLNFPLYENQQRRMCAKHFLEEDFVKLLVAPPVKRTTQSFVARHPITNPTLIGRVDRNDFPGILPEHKPRALAHDIDIIKQNRARVNQVRANRFAMQRIQ